MRIKKTIQIITATSLSIYLIYCVFHFITKDMHPTYLDCGKIVSKSTDEITIKYGVKTELYLNIQFENSGFRSVECDPTTYFSKKQGDNICFYLSKKEGILYGINHLAGLIIILVICFILCGLFFYYIAPESWK